MASFRVLDPFTVFLNLTGTAPASGGRFDFFEAGTTTPKAVYANPALSVSNGSTIELDAAGRLSADCWGDGAYRARQYDADDTLVKDLDNIQAPGGGAQTIPALEAGAFLSNDGALLLWDFINQLPDPTGQADKFVKTDGTGWSYEAITIPPAPALDVILTGTGAAGKVQLGTSAVARKLVILWGTDTMPASNQTQAAGAFTFPGSFSFDEAPRMFANGITTPVTAEGQLPVVYVSGTDPGAYGITMNTNEFGRNGAKITSAVTFAWIAFGFKTA